jgi:hypothetical protein
MEITDVRRRVRAAIEGARKESGERRLRSDAASKAYATFLEQQAVPAFRAVASALAGEGLRFKVFTPAESVRLASDSSAEDFIELFLDTTQDPPAVVGRTSRGRGRRSISSERQVRAGTNVAQLTEEDVVQFLVSEIGAFAER